MPDPNLLRMTASGSGAVTVRQRPSLLLMKLRLRAAEPTLELGLTKVKAQCEAASQWLKPLGAVRVEFGEPHFDDQTDKDPLTRMKVAATRSLGKRMGQPSPDGRERGVNVVLTAMWQIASMSAEQTLVLLDRLRFEAAADVGAAETPEETPSWTTPQEQLREMMAQINQPPPDDRGPHFLFIARLSAEQVEKATAEAYSRARQNAERLARAAGMSLGRLNTLHFGVGGSHDGRTDKLMDRQRCGALLAGSSYDLGENEIVSDDPRSAEFVLSVNASYSLEQVREKASVADASGSSA